MKIHFGALLLLSSSLASAQAAYRVLSVHGAQGAKTAKIELSPPTSKDCQPPLGSDGKPCDNTPLSKNDPRRHKFDKWIVEAANYYGLPPQLIKAQVHAETSFMPLLENQTEKANPSKQGAYRWGKGLGQFGANNARAYHLDWNAPKPSAETVMSDRYNQPDKNGIYPIWSPRGAILAKAKMLFDLQNKERKVRLLKAPGVAAEPPQFIRIDLIYKTPDKDGQFSVENARYLAGMYNRGERPLNSIEEHYRQTGKLPEYYGTAWSTPRIKTTPTPAGMLLIGEKVNRCHVYKIAGLCGDQPQGYFAAYAKDFSYNKKSGEWKISS